VSAQARAFAPGNISCVFKIVADPDPTKMHSLGMGLTVSDGVVATVRPAERTGVSFNGQDIQFPTVVSALGRLSADPLNVEIESPLQLGAGFGLSGASTLAVAWAVNDLLALGKNERDLAMIAHVAEVENLTGLGDVCAQYHGGCLVKLKVGDPLAAERLPVPEQPIYYQYFGPIHTRDVLADVEQRARINAAADLALKGLEELVHLDAVDFNACVRLSRAFAVDSGLLTDERVRRIIEEVEADGGSASMIMLGHAVFSTRSFAGAQQTMLGIHRVRML
jgi:pantoate kinase